MTIEQWWQDLRLAVRALGHARGFAVPAVLTLSIGIAGATVMFALIDAVLLRPLPVRAPDRLVVGWLQASTDDSGHWPFTTDDVALLGRESRTMSGVAGVGYNGALQMTVVEGESATRLAVARVTGNFFDVLGADPIAGRALSPADDVAGAESVLVLSARAWERRYAGSMDALGTRLTIGGHPIRIVGVMPDLELPRGVEAWLTVASLAAIDASAKAVHMVDIVGRLHPDATPAHVAAEVRAVQPRLDLGGLSTDQRVSRMPFVQPLTDAVVGDVRVMLLLLFAAVAFVLLIASANVANLMLVRGEGRRPEFAVRAALGAGRGRLARQLLAESAIVALGGAALALVLAHLALPMLIALAPSGLPRVASITLNPIVTAFTLLVSFLAAFLAGLAPVWSWRGANVANQLRQGSRGASGPQRGRRGLVVVQVALAVIVVTGAGLLTRSFVRLLSVDMGMAADRLVIVELSLPRDIEGNRTRHAQFLEAVLEKLRATGGVRHATAVNAPPYSGTGGWDALVTAEGQSVSQSAANPLLNLESVFPEYFDTLAVALVRGRRFLPADRENAPAVAIVSEDAAAKLWPGADPIGRRVKFGGPDSPPDWRTVVGVARATRYRELMSPRPTLYLPAAQFLVSAQRIVLQTNLGTAAAADLVGRHVREASPAAHVIGARHFTELLQQPLARPRFTAFLVGVFGVAALLLAAVGLYAALAAHVRGHCREMGIRAAIGATRRDLRVLVVWETVRLAGAGAAIGLVAALLSARWLRSLLFEIEPIDPMTLLASAALLVVVAAAAAYVPARRAADADPAVMLRSD
jgi:predicted permease